MSLRLHGPTPAKPPRRLPTSGPRPQPGRAKPPPTANATALLPVTLAAGLLAAAGKGYMWGALVLGVGFLGCAIAFAWSRSILSARRLFLVSVLYLPLLLGLMVFDR